ncbi:hypothetical protein GQR58_029977 [Nymphon striatum]|nr:hypothetical protein GQR58_029977 [Nymphon striatum]
MAKQPGPGEQTPGECFECSNRGSGGTDDQPQTEGHDDTDTHCLDDLGPAWPCVDGQCNDSDSASEESGVELVRGSDWSLSFAGDPLFVISSELIVTSEAEFTIDALAADAGLPASTVRMYQNRQLLPPPEKRGRVGYYNAGHRERLKLIAQLQEEGFSLAGIRTLLESWETGGSLQEVLGVATPGLRGARVSLSFAEIVETFGETPVTQAELQRAEQLGLLEPSAAGVELDPAFLDAGVRLAAMGVPVSETLGEYEALSASLEVTANRFADVFRRHVWDGFEARGKPEGELVAITQQVHELNAIATAVVSAVLADQLLNVAQRYLDLDE